MLAVSFWTIMGGHLTLGAVAAIMSFTVAVLGFNWHPGRALILYLAVCVSIWIIGDIMFGPYRFFEPCCRY